MNQEATPRVEDLTSDGLGIPDDAQQISTITITLLKKNFPNGCIEQFSKIVGSGNFSLKNIGSFVQSLGGLAAQVFHEGCESAKAEFPENPEFLDQAFRFSASEMGSDLGSEFTKAFEARLKKSHPGVYFR